MDASPEEIRARAALDDNAVMLEKHGRGRRPRKTVPGRRISERFEPQTLDAIKTLTGHTPRHLAENALDVLRLVARGASDEEIAQRVRSWLARTVDPKEWP